MRICKITNIKPDGKPWESQYGLMYPFYIVLEDGGAGTANSKTQEPAYKVGDTVGYDVTGNSPKGVPKLKITRNPKPGEGTVWVPDTHPDLEAAQAPTAHFSSRPQPTHFPAPAPVKTQGNAPINGQTVGMAVKAAVDIWIAVEASRTPDGFGSAQIANIERIARQLVSMSERIQSGEQSDESVPF